MDFPSREIIDQISKLASSRERYVLEMRLGIHNERRHTLQEIADKLELTRERVRQIQRSALLKLASKELNSQLLVSELAYPTPKVIGSKRKKGAKRINVSPRSGAEMNLPSQFIVVNFSTPVKGIDPLDGSYFFSDRHRIRADWARQDGHETLFMIDGEVEYRWPTNVITRITWPSGVDVPVTPREFENRMEEIKSEFPKAWSKWSYEEELKLTMYFSQGMKVSEIAKQMGRAPGGIFSRLRKMSLIDDSVEFSDEMTSTAVITTVTGTVYELIKNLYQVTLSQNSSDKVNKRFNESGWFLMVDQLFCCSVCAKSRIMILRKHWKNMGRVFHRWAIACLECDKIGETRDFDSELINSIHLKLELYPAVEELCPDCVQV